MDNDQDLADAAHLERYVTEALAEEALLWSLVALVRRLGRRPRRTEVDAVLAGTRGGCPRVSAQRQGHEGALGQRRRRVDDFARQQ